MFDIRKLDIENLHNPKYFGIDKANFNMQHFLQNFPNLELDFSDEANLLRLHVFV